MLSILTAIALLTGGVAAAFLVDRWAARDDFALSGLLVAVGLLPIVSGIIGSFRPAVQVTYLDAAPLSTSQLLIGRAGTLLFLGTAALVILRPRKDPPGKSLWAFAMTLAVARILTEFISPDPVSQPTLMLPLGLSALWVAQRLDSALVALWGKRVFGAGMVASAAVILLAAPSAWEEVGSSSTLPFMSIRFSGVFGHPNSLGPAAVLYLIFEYMSPSPRTTRRIMLPIALLLLIGAQSKTAWAAALLVTAVLLWGRFPHLRGKWLIFGILAVSATVLLVQSSLAPSPDAFISEESWARYRTLSSRTSLWEVGIEQWERSPIFGNGSLAFKRYAAQSGATWAGQGHNQFVQDLALHGGVGAFALLLYAGSLLAFAIRLRGESDYLSVALVAFLFVRMFTQVPLESASSEHLLIFGMLLAWERRRVARRDGLEAARSSTHSSVPVGPSLGSSQQIHGAV